MYKISIFFVLLAILLFPVNAKDNEDDVCGACHQNFKAFDANVKEKNGKIEVFVSNSQGHEVRNLTCGLVGLVNKTLEPYSEEKEGQVRRFQSYSYKFPVNEGATFVSVLTNGDAGIGGRNDIEIKLTAPNGIYWYSNEKGMNEKIIIYKDEIEKGGYGDYNLEITYITGIGKVEYKIKIDVLYESFEDMQKGKNLKKGEMHTFLWNLTSNEIRFKVSAFVYYDHEDDDIPDEAYYSYEIKFGKGIPKTKKFSFLPIGQFLGFLSTFFLFFTIALVYVPSLEKIAHLLKIAPMKLHCYIPLCLLSICTLHFTLLLTNVYVGTSKGAFLGGLALLSFIIIALISHKKFQIEIVKKINYNNWKALHFILTAFGIFMLLLHILIDGTTFR